MTDRANCPHCGKEIWLMPPDPEGTEAPSKESLDDALAQDAEFLHVTLGEGKVFYAMKEYIPGDEGKTIWRRVDNIMKMFGGKWISQGKESHWEVPT